MLKSISFLMICLASAAAADVRVIDGDTLELDGTTYRLNGIDAPEFGQKCISKGRSWTCGADALERLADITHRAKVACDPIETDPYGRIVATCTADGQDVGALMVATGLAWAFVKFSDDYVDEEAYAKTNKLGIWSGDNTPAWDFRAQRWEVAAQKAPKGCPIKGNISRNGRIYHPPWSPWYDRTRITTSKGERWFCDEAEAVNAGWRAPRWP